MCDHNTSQVLSKIHALLRMAVVHIQRDCLSWLSLPLTTKGVAGLTRP